MNWKRNTRTCTFSHWVKLMFNIFSIYSSIFNVYLFLTSCSLLSADVTNYSSFDTLVERIDEIVRDEGLNVILNNAGISSKSTRLSFTKETDLTKTFETNSVAPVMLTKVRFNVFSFKSLLVIWKGYFMNKYRIIFLFLGIHSIAEKGVYIQQYSAIGSSTSNYRQYEFILGVNSWKCARRIICLPYVKGCSEYGHKIDEHRSERWSYLMCCDASRLGENRYGRLTCSFNCWN